MSKEKRRNRNSRIQWPKTQEAKLRDLEVNQDAIATVAKVGRMMAAADVVPMPLVKNLMSQAVQAATQAPIGGGELKGDRKDRAWKRHADQYFATNAAWNEVNDIYLACVDVIQSYATLLPMLKEPALIGLVKNRKLLKRNTAAIVRDTTVMTKELNAIHETHKDKKDGSENQEDMVESCIVFTKYVDFIERYDAALLPLVLHTSEQLQEAHDELKKVNPVLAEKVSYDIRVAMAKMHKSSLAVTAATQPEAVPA